MSYLTDTAIRVITIGNVDSKLDFNSIIGYFDLTTRRREITFYGFNGLKTIDKDKAGMMLRIITEFAIKIRTKKLTTTEIKGMVDNVFMATGIYLTTDYEWLRLNFKQTILDISSLFKNKIDFKTIHDRSNSNLAMVGPFVGLNERDEEKQTLPIFVYTDKKVDKDGFANIYFRQVYGLTTQFQFPVLALHKTNIVLKVKTLLETDYPGMDVEIGNSEITRFNTFKVGKSKNSLVFDFNGTDALIVVPKNIDAAIDLLATISTMLNTLDTAIKTEQL